MPNDANVTDEIIDRLTEEDYDLLTVEAAERKHTRAVVAAALVTAIDVLRSQSLDPTMPARAGDRENRIQALQRELHPLISADYRKLYNHEKRHWQQLVPFVGIQTAKDLNGIVKANIFKARFPKPVVETIVTHTPINGHLPREWFRAQGERFETLFVGQVREGVRQKESLNQVTARVKKNLAPRLQRDAETLVRTAQAAITNEARQKLYEENADLLRGQQAINPLDNRTSDICRARAGMAWTMDGAPFPGTGTTQPFPGPPPWHFNCRTTLAPIVKSAPLLKKLRGAEGIRVRKAVSRLSPRQQRDLLGGRPGRALTFDAWLKRRPEVQQRKLLGPGKFKLWREGKLTMPQLIDRTGQSRTLAELRARFG